MKKLRKIIASVCLCCTAVLLASCGATGLTTMPNLEDAVKGNGGLSVVKGDYLYFVDSYVGYATLEKNDNKLGEIKTNALYRTKLADGKLNVDEKGVLSSYELVVSKVVGTENTGLFIFDDYIYYTTPNMQNDTTGKLRTDLVDFCRAKLDGTNVEILYTSEQYESGAKFAYYKIGTSVYLVVFDGKNVKQVEITTHAKNAITLVSDVSNVILPTIYDYNYANDVQMSGTQGNIYYTRNLTTKDFVDTTNKGNALGQVAIANPETKSERVDGVTTYELKAVESNYIYTYKTVNEHKTLWAISATQGFYNTAKDTQITTTSDYTNEYVMPNIDGKNNGIIINFDGNTIWVKDGTTINDQQLSEKANTVKFSDGHYAYYLDGTKMYRIDLNNTNIEENTELVFDDSTMDSTYLDFGEQGYIYYFATYTGDKNDSQKYLKRVDLSNKVQPEEDQEETDLGYATELVGVLKADHIKSEN